jgi:hypothetical protein
MVKVIPIKAEEFAPAPDAPAHAVLSPSASERWIRCPGSISATANVPARPGNKFSEEGTAAHTLLELCLVLDQDPDEFLGLEVEPGYIVTEEMSAAVGVAVDWVRDTMLAYPSLRLHAESRVKPGPLIGLYNGECEGTADIILEDGRLCIVADFKYGAGVYVEVKDNPQIKLYLAGARERNGKPYFKYRGVIIQPRNYSNNGRMVREMHLTEGELAQWLMKTVKPSALAALAPGAPRHAGDHCRWCGAAGSCRVFARHAATAAATEFGPMIDPTVELLL